MSQFMIALGLVLLIVNTCVCVYRFLLKREVALADTGAGRMMSVLVALLSLGMCTLYVSLYRRRPDNLWVSGLLLVGSAAYSAVVGWALMQTEAAKDRNLEILQMIVGVTEVGDPSLDGHSLNVLYLTMLLYDFLPWSYRRQVNRENLRYAALMIDLGKLGVPARIRNKSGKLTDEEWKMMKRHPEIGVQVMKTVPALSVISDWVLYHHERVDGGGYYKLKGDEIPLASRLIAVADTYSAITMERPYRPSLTYEEAITELKLASGTQLDPELVKCFCEIPPKRVQECLAEVRGKMERYTEERIREME